MLYAYSGKERWVPVFLMIGIIHLDPAFEKGFSCLSERKTTIFSRGLILLSLSTPNLYQSYVRFNGKQVINECFGHGCHSISGV